MNTRGFLQIYLLTIFGSIFYVDFWSICGGVVPGHQPELSSYANCGGGGGGSGARESVGDDDGGYSGYDATATAATAVALETESVSHTTLIPNFDDY